MLWRVIIGGIFLLVAACPPALATHPEYTSYGELGELVRDWERRGARIEVPARSRMGRDIHLVRIGSGPITLLMTNELHANEPSGTEAFVRFVELLLGNPAASFPADRLPGVRPEAPVFSLLAKPAVREELLRRVTIAGFPMMDPDAEEANHMRDQLANADYTTRATPQSAAIGHAFRTLEPDLMLDSHGGPNAPDLNIGYIKPDGVERAIGQAGVDAAAVVWRAADALAIKLAYFEEWPLALLTGQHGDPFTSVDQAYYDLLTGVAPITQESYALEGLPVIYTETVGLQSTDPSITVSQGASAQEVAMAGLALEASGLLTGTRPAKVIRPAQAGPLSVGLPPGTQQLLAVVHWGRGVAEEPGGAAQDYELVVRGPDGRELGRSAGGARSATRRSRAVAIAAPPAGRVIIDPVAVGDAAAAGAVLRVTWRSPDAGTPKLAGVLGPRERVAYCLADDTLWDRLDASHRAPRCDQYAPERPAVSAPPSSPRRCVSRRRFTIRVARPRSGRLLGASVTVAGRRVAVHRRQRRLVATVDLRGRRAGRYTVRITARTSRGSFVTVRRYRTCAPR